MAKIIKYKYTVDGKPRVVLAVDHADFLEANKDRDITLVETITDGVDDGTDVEGPAQESQDITGKPGFQTDPVASADAESDVNVAQEDTDLPSGDGSSEFISPKSDILNKVVRIGNKSYPAADIVDSIRNRDITLSGDISSSIYQWDNGNNKGVKEGVTDDTLLEAYVSKFPNAEITGIKESLEQVELTNAFKYGEEGDILDAKVLEEKLDTTPWENQKQIFEGIAKSDASVKLTYDNQSASRTLDSKKTATLSYTDPDTGEISDMVIDESISPKKKANMLKSFMDKYVSYSAAVKLNNMSKYVDNLSKPGGPVNVSNEEVEAAFPNQDTMFDPYEEQSSGLSASGVPGSPGQKSSWVVQPYEVELKATQESIIAEREKQGATPLSQDELLLKSESAVLANLKADKRAELIKKKTEALITSNKDDQGLVSLSKLISKTKISKESLVNINQSKSNLNNLSLSLGALDNVFKYLNGGKITVLDVDTPLGMVKLGDLSDGSDVMIYKSGVKLTKDQIAKIESLEATKNAEVTQYEKLMVEGNAMNARYTDLEGELNASLLNYNLASKYATSFTLGVTDIATGLAYTGAKLSKFSPIGAGINYFTDDALDNAVEGLAVDYKTFSNNLRASFVSDVSINDAFSDAISLGKFVTQEIVAQVPVLLAMAASGGLGAYAPSIVVGAYTGGQKGLDISYEDSLTGEQSNEFIKMAKMIGYGLGNGVFTHLTTNPILQRGIKTFKTNNMGDDFLLGVKDYATQNFKRAVVTDHVREVTGELATNVVEKAIDGKPIFEDAGHVALTSTGFSFVFSTLPFIKGVATRYYSNTHTQQLMDKRQVQINELVTAYKKLDGRTKAAKVILSQVLPLIDAQQATIDGVQKNISTKIDKQGAFGFQEVQNRITRARVWASEVVNDPNLSKKEKAATLASLEAQFEIDVKARDNFVDEKTFGENFYLLRATDIEAHNRLINEAVTETGKSASSPEVIAKAIELYNTERIIENNSKAKKIKPNFESFTTAKEAMDFVAGLEGKVTPENIKSAIDNIRDGGAGANIPLISGGNLPFAITESQLTQGKTSVGLHEVGHWVMPEIFRNNPQKMIDFAKNVENWLAETDPKLKQRLDLNLVPYAEMDAEIKAEESLMAFFELIGDGKIDMNSRENASFSGMLAYMSQDIAGNDYDFNFKGSEDFAKFAIALGTKIKNGDLSFREIVKVGKLIKPAEETGEKTAPVTKASKASDTPKAPKNTVLEAINNLVPETVKTKADFQHRSVFNPIYQATLPNGSISNYIKSRSENAAVAEKAIESIQDRLLRYDPAAKRKTNNKEPITLGEFIFSNTNYSKLDAKKALAIEGVETKRKTSIDSAEAKEIADTSTTTQEVREEPKYKKLVASRVLGNEVLRSIKDKVLRTVKVLKNKMDAPISVNRAVTPLIGEIKAEMGKQADIDLKKAMGGKKGKVLEKFLTANKKPILENMTTTWLTGAIPKVIEKSVGGHFKIDATTGKKALDINGKTKFIPKWVKYPEWVGKEIDREKSSTENKGGTSGDNFVRRVKNVNDAITDQEFLDHFVDSEGTPLRGKKESLAKAMGEEVGFELFTQQIKDPDSPIRKAFEKNQKALGAVIAENIVEELSRQVERGNVKFSKTAIEQGINNEISKAIGTEIFRNKLTTNILDPNNNNPFYTTVVDYFNEFPISEIKRVTQLKNVAHELSSNYSNKIFGEIGVQRIVDQEGVIKTIDYLLEASEDALIKGDSYATIQLLLKGENSKLDEKTLEGLNLGRAAALKIVKQLAEQGFTGNEIKGIFTAVYSPSGLGGFKGKLKADGKTRAVPESVTLIEDDLGIQYIKENKKTGKSERQSYGSFMINTADFEQNFLKGIEMGPKNSTRTDAFTKNFWKDATSKYNKLDNAGKKEYLQELQKGKEKYEASLLSFIEAVRSADISTDAVRTFIRAPFAAMDGLGKITSAPRWMPSLTDGTLLSLKDLVKLGFGRKDGKVDQGVFEHTKPANRVALAAFRYALTGDKSDLDSFILELADFDTAFITEGMDRELVRNKLQSLMGLNYVRGGGVMNTRYTEMVGEMADAGVTFYDAKTNTLLSAAAVFSKEMDQEMETNFAPVKAAQAAIQQGIKLSKPTKKIRVFDFDDTIGITESNVLYTMPDGTTGKIDAATFAKESGKMEAQGVVWDFSEFSEVMNGKEGPLLGVAKLIADKRGTQDIFVLTARPQDAAGPIKEFLASMGLNIPLKNITGLGNGSPQAKADWMIPKIAEGYNDFYFADDHTGNVKAVKDLLDTFDVKGKVQQAKVKFSKSLDKEFNDMIARDKGIVSEAEFSRKVARTRGARKGKWKLWMPTTLDDFKGLTSYVFAGKGRQGDADQKFFQEAMITPYFRGVAAIETARQTIANDFKKLNKLFKPVAKKLGKLLPSGDYTHDQAIRVYLWDKAGYDIPGLSKRDKSKLVEFVANSPELSSYANGALLLSKDKDWIKPSAYWDVETLLSDLNNLTEKSGRKEYLAEFIENADIIFSEKNLNKIEAAYGTSQREALEDILYRMKNGTNRPSGMNKNANKFNNWVNNSVGAIMFFNRRSAVLQLLSTVNFINWSDNNPAKAALAFANQPQYWADFATIFNSDKLKQRRSGLRGDVNEAEIASAVQGSRNKATAALSYLLKIGFTPTQIADSFAISAGGATFYRNRINTLLKQGMDQSAAEKQAWTDFSNISEETQQSGDPALISSDQASTLGRLVLTFMNTPIQLNRSIKKASLDIYNRRRTKGMTQAQSDFSNISKVIYYGAIQNAIFSSLQSAMFALIPGFDDEEETVESLAKKKEQKVMRMVSSMIDTTLKGGFGIPGAVLATVKNIIIEYHKQQDKGFIADHTYTVLQAANLAPPIGSKLSKGYKAIQTDKFEADAIGARGWDVTIDGKFNLSPNYSVLGNVIEGTTNIPTARVVQELNSITEALDSRNNKWQQIALGLGWKSWEVGATNEEHDLIKVEAGERKKVLGEKARKKKREEDKEAERIRVSGLSEDQLKEEAEIKSVKKKEKAVEKERLRKKYDPDYASPKVAKDMTPEEVLIKRKKVVKGLTKQEQITILRNSGLSRKKVRELQYEADRVDAIIEIRNKQKAKKDKLLKNKKVLK